MPLVFPTGLLSAMILIIDNEDPAINVLANALRISGETVRVFDNTDLSLVDICDLRPRGLVFSEGLGHPEDAGVTLSAIRTFASFVPILGVGLGHRAVGMAFGGSISGSAQPDATGTVTHDHLALFEGLDDPFEVTSDPAPVLVDDEFPVSLQVAARTDSGIIMGVRHRGFKTEGIQFRLENMDPALAEQLVSNWISSLYDIHDETFDRTRKRVASRSEDPSSSSGQGGNDDGPSEAEETLVYESDGKSMFDRMKEQEEERQKEEQDAK
jgi:anthranilate/para-aminobenzoate synthase component II